MKPVTGFNCCLFHLGQTPEKTTLSTTVGLITCQSQAYDGACGKLSDSIKCNEKRSLLI